MKKFISLLLILFLIFSYSNAELGATETDLVEYMEFDDDDWGYIDITFERQVYITMEGEPQYYGDTVIFIAVLMNFKQEDKVTFQWQYAIEPQEWISIEGANEQTYTFILDKDNVTYWYRVIVELED